MFLFFTTKKNTNSHVIVFDSCPGASFGSLEPMSVGNAIINDEGGGVEIYKAKSSQGRTQHLKWTRPPDWVVGPDPA